MTKTSRVCRPLLLLALTGSLAQCGSGSGIDARALAQDEHLEEAAPEETAEVRRLRPAQLRAPEGSPRARALAAREAGAPGEALAIAEHALEGLEDSRERRRLHWIAAEAAAAGDENERASHHYAVVAGSLVQRGEAAPETPAPLSRWAALRYAALLRPTDAPGAAIIAGRLASAQYDGEGDRWAGQTRAALLEALCLVDADDWEAAEPRLRALMAPAMPNRTRSKAALALAQHLTDSEDAERREEAVGLYREVASRAPRSSQGREAAAKAQEVLRTLPRERQQALRETSIDAAFRRAHSLYNAMQHREAERAFLALARRLRRNPQRRCEADLMAGKAMLRRREREAGAAHLVAVAERCADPDIQAWAHFKAGRAFAQTEHRAEALAQYAAVEDAAPEHRLADDALFRSALVELGAGNQPGATERFRQVCRRYPEGDMCPKSLFRLGLMALSEGDFANAGTHFSALAEDPRETTEGVQGRAAYWSARMHHRALRPEATDAQKAEVARAYLAVAERWPLSFYGLLAHQRHRELAPSNADAFEAQLQDRSQVAFSFPWRDEFDSPAFVEVLELLQVGAVDHAQQSLDALGFFGEGADPDALWVAAACLHEAGALPEVTRLVRRRLDSFRQVLPRGEARNLWRLAYPKAFEPLVEEKAGEVEVPPAFVRAVAREESSFEPRAVSWAHAYGLVQVILPTARRWGRSLDVNITPATLKRPEVNLAVGARYMAYLRGRYEQNPALVPASYNAGQGSLDRWLRQRGNLEYDEFVERIPYDETRRYTRRVVQSWIAYTWLDEGRLLEIPNRVR